ncbi:MAG: DUF1573 domain-containing protein [candidate division Zixibacteria bacterium]|nr:DUF1573 domain-containing protein [candidate division Zixibacteria bacterium]
MKRSAAPNDSLPIELLFSSGRRNDRQVKAATVSCNDRSKGKFELHLDANVYKHADSTTPIVITRNNYLKLTSKDLGKTYEIEYQNISKGSLTAELIDYPTEVMTVKMPTAAVAPGKMGKITVRINPKLTRRNFQKSFTFELSDSADTRFSIPVMMTESGSPF